MPTLETPPNPVIPTPPETSRLAAGRFGELDHSEIVHLLSTLDDEVARSRFRESVYISLIICLAIAWFAFYGPRVLFHQGRIVPVAADRHKNELSYLEVPPDLKKVIPPKNTKVISDRNALAQTAHPMPAPPVPRAGAPNPPAPAPRPLPPTPQPQQQTPPQPQQPRPQPQQPAPTPLPRQAPQQATNIPDAPRPNQTQTKPNFSTPSNPGDAIRSAANAAAQQHAGGNNGDNGTSHPRGHAGANTGYEILSDTLGTDFGPYIKHLLRTTQAAWYPLIPEECYPPLNKTGMTLIRFTINADGHIAPGSMHLDNSTRDIAIDKAAWGSITSQGQFQPLPATFKGPNIELRIQFNIVREGTSTE